MTPTPAPAPEATAPPKLRPPAKLCGPAGGAPASAAGGGPVVRTRNLSLTFETADGPVYALSEIDLTVAEGDFVSLIGPSGCGKTTLLRVIADLEQPTDGEIQVNGVSPTRPGSTAPTATSSRPPRSTPGARSSAT